jgi:enoyl-CoA hydratase
MADVVVDRADGILRIRMNRPDRLNALDAGMADAMADAIAHTSDIRVAMVTGTGRAFSSGAVMGDNPTAAGPVLPAACRLVRAIVAAPFPVVAAVNGLAAGVGCSIAIACDISIIRSSGYLLQAFVGVGLMPDGGATELIAASIGRARAMRLLLSGERLGGAEAVELGLVTSSTPDAEFDEVVEGTLRRLAAGPTLAYAQTKHAVNAASIPSLDAALDRESAGQARLASTTDHAEGKRAFRERRPAVFTGH